MSKASGHFAKGGAGYFAHNDRTTQTNNAIFSDESNEVSLTAKEAFKLYRDELAKRSKAYSDRTNQKLQKNSTTHRSLIINLNSNHTLKDLEPIKKHLEEALDTKVLQIAIHRDEGHISDDGKKIKNYHAHIEIMGIDSLGFSIAQHQKKSKSKTQQDFKQTRTKRLDSKFYSEFQTFLAKTLQMERGQKNSKAKRLDTYEYKTAMKIKEQELAPALSENKELKLTVTSLKATFELFRREMSNAKMFKKEDYQELAKLKKSVNKHNLDDVYSEFLAFKKKLEQLKQSNDTLNKQNEAYKQDIDDLKIDLQESKSNYVNLEKINDNLEEKVADLELKVVKTIQPKVVENPLNRELEAENTRLKSVLRNYKNALKEIVPVAKSPSDAFETLSHSAEKLNKALEIKKYYKTDNELLKQLNEAYKQDIVHLKAKFTDLKNKEQSEKKDTLAHLYSQDDLKNAKNITVDEIASQYKSTFKSYLKNKFDKDLSAIRNYAETKLDKKDQDYQMKFDACKEYHREVKKEIINTPSNYPKITKEDLQIAERGQKSKSNYQELSR